MSHKTVKCKDFEIANNKKLTLISGPCQIESEQHSIDIASQIKELTSLLGINYIFKSSFDKANRTSISGARGIGLDKSLKIFDKIKNQLNLPVLTDVHNTEQCSILSDVIDIIQIPAFLCLSLIHI